MIPKQGRVRGSQQLASRACYICCCVSTDELFERRARAHRFGPSPPVRVASRPQIGLEECASVRASGRPTNGASIAIKSLGRPWCFRPSCTIECHHYKGICKGGYPALFLPLSKQLIIPRRFCGQKQPQGGRVCATGCTTPENSWIIRRVIMQRIVPANTIMELGGSGVCARALRADRLRGRRGHQGIKHSAMCVGPRNSH